MIFLVITLFVLAILFLLWRCHQLEVALAVETQKAKGLEGTGMAFKALSSEALERNNEAFLHLANESLGKFHAKAIGELKPVSDTLNKLDTKLQALEKERKGDHEALKEQLKAMAFAEKSLEKETAELKRALRAPNVRGKWGEIQLKRVVELAGMVERCDFFSQPMVDGGLLKPDMIIRLPGSRTIVIDAKTPLDAYLAAQNAEREEERALHLKNHAQALRLHMTTLGKKSYWEQFDPCPEFVVLFLPSENLFSAALEQDPTLVEVGVSHQVILATPTTLIGLLKAIAYGWKQEMLSSHMRQVSELGNELYKRLGDLTKHFSQMGRSLNSSVEAFNKMAGSLESRVLVTARKFHDLGVTTEEIPPLEVIERHSRQLQAPELRDSDT